jgi:hypothetical protein
VPNYVNERHDIGLLRQDGTTSVGLMLVRDNTGKPLYRTYQDKYLSQQSYIGETGYGQLDPESEIRMLQSDWRAGMGKEYYDSNDPKRYYSSIGCDLRNGQAIAGWTSTGITLPTGGVLAYAVTNPSFEAASSFSNLTQSNEQAYHGTYSGKTALMNQGMEKSGYQAITWSTTYQSQEFTFTIYAYGYDDKCLIKIGIEDGVGTTWGTESSSNAAWKQYTVTRTLDASATHLYLYWHTVGDTDALNTYAYFDVAKLVNTNGMAGTPKCHVFFGRSEFIGIGSRLVALTPGAPNAFTPIKYDFPAIITSLETMQVAGVDYLFVALNGQMPYWYATTVLSWTESTATNNQYEFFKLVHTTADTLYGNDGDNTIRSTVNPLNGGTAWSNPATYVGAVSIPITALQEKSGALYIMKEDLTYYLDSSGNPQSDLAPEQKSAKSTHSGKNNTVWQNELFIPCGDQALLRVGTTNEWINPSKYCTNLTEMTGQVEACEGDEEWLYTAIDYSTKVEILAGREETIDGSTSWRWHPIHQLTLAGVETMWITTLGTKRLFISSTSSSDSLYYMALPTKYGDITNDSNRAYATDSSAYFITPWLHANFRGDSKAFIKITASLGHTYSANVYWTCAYEVLGDTSWTTVGNFKGTASSMIESLYIPADGSGNKPISPYIRFKFTAVTNSATVTPILVDFNVQAILRPSVRNIIECAVRCADEIRDKDGSLMQGISATYIRTVLNEAQAATWPFTFYDLWGITKTVTMLPSPTYSEIVDYLKQENPSEYFYLRLQEISLS